MNTAKISGSPVRGLTAATIGFFFGSAAISLFGPSATKLNEVMDLSPSMMGLLVAIPTLSGSLLRIPFGASVDENGGRKSFLLLMILSVIGLAGLSILLGTHYPSNMRHQLAIPIISGHHGEIKTYSFTHIRYVRDTGITFRVRPPCMQ
jgi:NNP family nitrate/nitrite transporter-like MFS transporter